MTNSKGDSLAARAERPRRRGRATRVIGAAARGAVRARRGDVRRCGGAGRPDAASPTARRAIRPAEPELGACLAAGCPDALHERQVSRLEDHLFARMPGLDPALHEDLARAILAEAEAARLDPLLVLAVIEVESGYDPSAAEHRRSARADAAPPRHPAARGRGARPRARRPRTIRWPTSGPGSATCAAASTATPIRERGAHGLQRRAQPALRLDPGRRRAAQVVGYARRVLAERHRLRQTLPAEAGPRFADAAPAAGAADARHRDLPQHPGGGDAGRAALRLRALHRLRPALHLVRHRLRLPRAGRSGRAQSIVAELNAMAMRHVCLTGGEPLLQPELPELCRELLAAGWEVTVETHGQRDAEALPPEVVRIFDVKPPGSGRGDPRLRLPRSAPAPGRGEVRGGLGRRTSTGRWRWPGATGCRAGWRCCFSPVVPAVEPKTLAAWLLAAGHRGAALAPAAQADLGRGRPRGVSASSPGASGQ